MLTTVPHWEYMDHAERDHSGSTAQYDADAECPFKVGSIRDLTPGIPALTDEAMGWLAYSSRRTSTLAGKWGKDDAVHASWDNKTGAPIDNYYRYDLAYSTFAVALMAQQTPAWREVYTDILDFTAQRFISYWTCFDWIERKGEDPDRNNYPDWWYEVLMPKGMKGKYDSPGWPSNGLPPFAYDADPVRGNGHCNAMYKGYLSYITGMYALLSGDDKYDHPFKIVYDDSLTFEYNNTSLNELISNQFYTTASGISCEVTKAFGLCNNISATGLKLHDAMHGTSLQMAYYDFLTFYKKNYMVGGEGDGPIERYALYHDMTHETTLNEEQNQFSHNFMATSILGSSFDENLHRRLYEGGMRKFFTPQPDGSAWMEGMPGTGVDFHYGTATALFAAREWGDNERYSALRSWVRKEYEPTWDTERGEFYCHLKLGETWPRGQYNDWLMPGFTITEPGQWRNMINSPNLAKFRQPTVVGVDFPTVRPRQAFYDADERALFVSIASCEKSRIGEPTSFQVTNLLPGANYRLTIDGVHGESLVQAPGGTLRIDTEVGTHAIVLQQVGA